MFNNQKEFSVSTHKTKGVDKKNPEKKKEKKEKKRSKHEKKRVHHEKKKVSMRENTVNMKEYIAIVKGSRNKFMKCVIIIIIIM